LKISTIRFKIYIYYEITVDMLEQMNDLRVTDGKIDDIINSEKGSHVAGGGSVFLRR
jgi:hypothetical protein